MPERESNGFRLERTLQRHLRRVSAPDELWTRIVTSPPKDRPVRVQRYFRIAAPVIAAALVLLLAWHWPRHTAVALSASPRALIATDRASVPKGGEAEAQRMPCRLCHSESSL